MTKTSSFFPGASAGRFPRVELLEIRCNKRCCCCCCCCWYVAAGVAGGVTVSAGISDSDPDPDPDPDPDSVAVAAVAAVAAVIISVSALAPAAIAVVAAAAVVVIYYSFMLSSCSTQAPASEPGCHPAGDGPQGTQGQVHGKGGKNTGCCFL